ncbi:hypothetical protein ACGVWS_01455 [Enterobacteriaceae bacterium LUAb1]
MLMITIVFILIALMGFAFFRHWKICDNKSVSNPRRFQHRR